MPLPVSLDNLTQAMGAGGDSGVTDEDGRVTLRLMPGHPHLVVVAPMPFALPVPEGVEPPVWNWRLEPDFRTILPWHTDTASTKAASATEHAPTLLVER